MGIEPSKRNTDAVSTFPEPKSVKKVGAILGLCVLYRRFIKNYAFIARFPHELFRKNQEYVWTKNERISFRKLIKQVLTSALVLSYLDFAEPFPLNTNPKWKGKGNIAWRA